MAASIDPSDAIRASARLERLTEHLPGRLRHVEHLPARTATTTDLPGWVAPAVRVAVVTSGIERLWSHQAATAELAHQGRDVVVATGTASGKSL